MYFMTHTYLQAHTLFSTITLLFSLCFVCFLALLLLPWLTIEEWFNQGECPPSALLTSASFSPPSFLLLIHSCRLSLEVVLDSLQKVSRCYRNCALHPFHFNLFSVALSITLLETAILHVHVRYSRLEVEAALADEVSPQYL